MRIPTVARQKGITVRLYAFLFVVSASVGTSLSFSPSASAALLPISDIPIVGKPVAGVVNTVTDGVVKPAANTVAAVLPQPLGAAVQAPVGLVTRATAPIAGPTIPTTPRGNVAARVTEPISPVAKQTTSTQQQNHSALESSDVHTTKTSPLIANYIPLTLSGYLPAISDMIAKFATNKDISPFIAAAVIIGLMLVVLTGLVVIIIRNSPRSTSPQELTFIRQDLTQTSVLILGLLVLGSALLFYILRWN